MNNLILFNLYSINKIFKIILFDFRKTKMFINKSENILKLAFFNNKRFMPISTESKLAFKGLFLRSISNSFLNKIFINQSSNNFLSLSKKHFTIIDVSSNASTNFSNFNSQNLSSVKKFVGLDVTNIQDNFGAKKVKRRLGRGPGSSKGKTSARGHKIRGEPYRHFEGGQTNVFRRLPKHGFRTKKFKDDFACINIQKILYLIHKGRIDPSKPIGVKEIFYAGGVSKVVDGIKLLSRGAENLKMFPKLDLIVQSATEKSIQALKDNGGSVTIAHGTRLYNRYLVKPAKFTKELVEPYPSFKRVRRMLNLKEKGAL